MQAVTNIGRFLLVLLLGVGALVASELRPAKADITLGSGSELRGVYVIEENMESLQYSPDERGDQAIRMRRADVARVEYDTRAVDAHSFMAADGHRNQGNWERAVTSYAQALESSRLEWVLVESLIGSAHCLAELEQWDRAVAALDQVLVRYPRHVRLVETIDLKGRVLIRARRLDAASKAFSDLLRRANDYDGRFPTFTREARAKGHYGLGLVAQERQDWASATQSFSQAQETLADDVSFDAPLYAQAVLALGKVQGQARQSAESLKTYQGLRYQPVSGEYRSEAFLQAGELLFATGAHMEAFDHAIMAGVVRGSAVRTQARRLANRIFSEAIDNAADISLEDKQSYRDYINRL